MSKSSLKKNLDLNKKEYQNLNDIEKFKRKIDSYQEYQKLKKEHN